MASEDPKTARCSHRQRVRYLAGASGTGTSTRAAHLQREFAAELGAPPTLVVSTDVVRAQLRAVLDREAHTDLWGESFNLEGRPGDRLREGVNIDAFLRQCAPILRAVEAGVGYGLTEGWDVIVEGVHLVPGEFSIAQGERLDVGVELLVVEDIGEHAARFRARDAASGGRRPAEPYVLNLPRIHAVQAELVERWHASGLD